MEQSFKVAAAVEHMKNERVAPVDAVDDDIISDSHTSQAGAQIVITTTAQVWMFGEHEEALGDRIDQAVGNIRVTASCGNVGPNLIKLCLDFCSNSESHQRCGARCPPRRARPRRFTSLASSRTACLFAM